MGWQIDPFGHSREFASLLSAMGYDGLFLGRIDFQDKRSRLKNKEMEMLWRGDDDLGKDFFARLCYISHIFALDDDNKIITLMNFRDNVF